MSISSSRQKVWLAEPKQCSWYYVFNLFETQYWEIVLVGLLNRLKGGLRLVIVAIKVNITIFLIYNLWIENANIVLQFVSKKLIL